MKLVEELDGGMLMGSCFFGEETGGGNRTYSRANDVMFVCFHVSNQARHSLASCSKRAKPVPSGEPAGKKPAE